MRIRSIRTALAVSILALAFAASPGTGALQSASAGPLPPDTKITFGPEGWTHVTRPVFGYTSNDPDAYFECRLDSEPFFFCGPATYEVLEGHPGAELSEGTHTIEVRAVGPSGEADPTPAQAVFMVDTHAPTAAIVSGPTGFTHQQRPKFTLRIAGADRVSCHIVGKKFQVTVPSCDEMTSFRPPRPLPEGTYELVVVARDLAFNETEDRVEFSVRTKPGPPPPPPNQYRGSVLYTGRGKGIKKVSFRLRGRKLIEATVVYLDRCTTRGEGQGGRYRLRQALTYASPRYPLRLDARGRFRVFRSEVFFNADETEIFAGKVTSRSIVGKFARESNESAPESGIFDKCHTGPFEGPMEELSFHAWRR
ncbi:MAG TPA: Ig-like domain-containing protein [Solirubrobacterales bacterium]|nr:Ig-like domain-containing protein [Solirubrobacterales bacterium]